MVDVVERSAVYEMLDKIQQDVYDGDGFQHDKWVEYVDAMKKERIMTEDMFERAERLIEKIRNTQVELDRLAEVREKMCAAKDTENITLSINCRYWCGCVYPTSVAKLIEIVDEEIAHLKAELVSAKEEFEAL